ncbi:MAG: ASCH domain-containing protein [Pseudomonadota bacterium]
MKKRILLSIHPEYANAIFDGRKGFEFRRVLFKKDVREIVVYATSPISRVIGKFEIEDIYVDSPNELWAKTEFLAGVTKEKFDTYFKDREKAFAIKVSNPVRFSKSQPLSNYVSSNTPPQSFCYV